MDDGIVVAPALIYNEMYTRQEIYRNSCILYKCVPVCQIGFSDGWTPRPPTNAPMVTSHLLPSVALNHAHPMWRHIVKRHQQSALRKRALRWKLVHSECKDIGRVRAVSACAFAVQNMSVRHHSF